MKRRSRRRKPGGVVQQRTEKHTGASPDLINGRAMMTVSILYEDVSGKGLEHKDARGPGYLREYLRDYKQYQSDVLRCLDGCYEVLMENHAERKEPVDPKHIQIIKKTIKDAVDVVWHGKKGKKLIENPDPKPPEPELKSEPITEPESAPEPESADEEVDWESRFADGEFDLE
jgi:hypothetical protein